VRVYGQLEREIIYYRDNKKCAVCSIEIPWTELEIHHINEHQNGGRTRIENGLPVHKDCHSKGMAAINFFNDWKLKHQEIEQLKSEQPDNEETIEKFYPSPYDIYKKKNELVSQKELYRIRRHKENDVLLDQIIPVIKSNSTINGILKNKYPNRNETIEKEL